MRDSKRTERAQLNKIADDHVKSRQWINDVTPTKGGRINEHFSTC
jgi:hypothetical protein